MTVEESSVQESTGLMSRATKSVGDTYDRLKSKAPTTDQVKSGIGDQTTRVSDAYGQAKGRLGLRDYGKLTQMFKEWLPTLAGEGPAKKLRTESRAAISWLADLPEEELESFVRGLDTYCSSFNFDLEWLIEPETNSMIDGQLKQSMGEIVLLFCVASWRADQIQDGIKVFVNLQKWLEDPFSDQYEEFNQQLFTKLIAEELVPAPPLELFLAPKEERKAYSVQAIQNLITENNQRFYELLRAEIDMAAAESVAETGDNDKPSEDKSVETS